MWSRSRSGPLRSGSNKIIMALGGSGSATLLFFSIQITLRPLYFLCRVHVVVVVSFSHCKTNSPLLLYDRNPLPNSKRPIFATSDTTPPPPPIHAPLEKSVETLSINIIYCCGAGAAVFFF